MKRQQWLMRVLVGMLVAAMVLAIVTFAFPAPTHAAWCIRVQACSCGCCGADKAVWDVICYMYNYCAPGWHWCYIGSQCDTC